MSGENEIAKPKLDSKAETGIETEAKLEEKKQKRNKEESELIREVEPGELRQPPRSVVREGNSYHLMKPQGYVSKSLGS